MASPLGCRLRRTLNWNQFWSALASTPSRAPPLAREAGIQSFSQRMDRRPIVPPGHEASHEVRLEHYSFATIALPSRPFSGLMTSGAIRAPPQLRLYGGHRNLRRVLGPLADNLDSVGTRQFRRASSTLHLTAPSALLLDNVRVAPFNWFRPVDPYFRQLPQHWSQATSFHHSPTRRLTRRPNKHNDKVGATRRQRSRPLLTDNCELLFPEPQHHTHTSNSTTPTFRWSSP